MTFVELTHKFSNERTKVKSNQTCDLCCDDSEEICCACRALLGVARVMATKTWVQREPVWTETKMAT